MNGGEDSRPTHPRTVTWKECGEPGRHFRIVLSPRAMRALTAARLSDEEIASDCFRRFVHNESGITLLCSLADYAVGSTEQGGWSDYADAVALATEVK